MMYSLKTPELDINVLNFGSAGFTTPMIFRIFFVLVCALALHSKYSKYATDGFTALYTRPPVIYISGMAPPDFGKILRNWVCKFCSVV